MTNRKAIAALMTGGLMAGFAVTGVTEAFAHDVDPPAGWDAEVRVETNSTRPEAEVEAELRELFERIETTGMVPVGPVGGVPAYAEANKYVSVAGAPHPDLELYDIGGNHIGYVVFGGPPMTVAEYEANPEGARQAGADRIADLQAGLGG